MASQTIVIAQQDDDSAPGGGGPPVDEVTLPGAPVTGTSLTGATINDAAPATPYPLLVPIAGITGNVSKVTVTVNDLTHTSVRDVDILLVAPTDDTKNLVILSDVGGILPVTNLDLTFDDAAATNLPGGGTPVSGTYRPTDCDGNVGGACQNTGAEDSFPAPAPAVVNEPAAAGTATFASVFNGMTPAQANGNWRVYIVDDSGGDSGTVGTVSITIDQTAAPLAPGSLIISEFRLRGPDPDGAGAATGANDEFIELYNTTTTPIVVTAIDGSGGYGVVASDGTVRCTVPNATVIPANGHFLCANNNASGGYSLGSYPAGVGTTATPNATYTLDIQDNAGIALFQGTNAATFTLGNRLDAVGSSTEANALYKEGTGYPALTASVITTNGANNTFYRDLCNIGSTTNRCTVASGDSNNYGGGGGTPKDTGNNATDFLYADQVASAAGAGERLGAPGPENLSSPIQRNASFSENLLDATKASSLAPNRVRDFTVVPTTGPLGTLSIRRRYTNNTGAAVTRLRFRITNITTFPAGAGFADLRAITTPADIVVSGVTDPATCASIGTPTTQPCSVTVRATTLETPPAQPNGGGFNSSWSVAIPGGTLANGASIGVNFRLGVATAGNFRLLLNIEALP